VDALPKPVSFETARLALAHLNFDGERERNAALERAARICSSALGVDRVGVWLLEQGTNQLVCPNLFDRAEGGCRVGETIELDLAVAYRDALFTRKVIVAEDAQHALATSALTDTYLRPLGITSKLDAPIFREGEVVGVVCLEHVGPKRVWSDSECSFASSVADISLAVAQLPRAGDAERARLQADLTSWTSTGAEMVQRLKDFATASRQGDRCDASDVLIQLGAMLTLLCKETADSPQRARRISSSVASRKGIAARSFGRPARQSRSRWGVSSKAMLFVDRALGVESQRSRAAKQICAHGTTNVVWERKLGDLLSLAANGQYTATPIEVV
jgi:GAF domain-containing protein